MPLLWPRPGVGDDPRPQPATHRHCRGVSPRPALARTRLCYVDDNDLVVAVAGSPEDVPVIMAGGGRPYVAVVGRGEGSRAEVTVLRVYLEVTKDAVYGGYDAVHGRVVFEPGHGLVSLRHPQKSRH
jgi:hypothetical protein